MQGMFRLLGRVGAMIIGTFGAVIAFATNILYSSINDALKLGGDNATHQTHGFLGFFLTIIALLGAIAAPFSGLVSAVIMVLCGLAFFWVVGIYAIPASVLLFIAAAMAYVDRGTPGHQHPVLHSVKGANPPSLPPQ